MKSPRKGDQLSLLLIILAVDTLSAMAERSCDLYLVEAIEVEGKG